MWVSFIITQLICDCIIYIFILPNFAIQNWYQPDETLAGVLYFGGVNVKFFWIKQIDITPWDATLLWLVASLSQDLHGYYPLLQSNILSLSHVSLICILQHKHPLRGSLLWILLPSFNSLIIITEVYRILRDQLFKSHIEKTFHYGQYSTIFRWDWILPVEEQWCIHPTLLWLVASLSQDIEGYHVFLVKNLGKVIS